MKKPRILVVDDEEAILYAYKRLLGDPKMGMEVDTAKSLKEAKAYLKKHKYKVILTDLRLGIEDKFSGFQITRLVKRIDKDATVILVTAYGNFQVKKRAYELGAEFYLEKPVSIHVLKNVLNSILNPTKEQ